MKIFGPSQPEQITGGGRCSRRDTMAAASAGVSGGALEVIDCVLGLFVTVRVCASARVSHTKLTGITNMAQITIVGISKTFFFFSTVVLLRIQRIPSFDRTNRFIFYNILSHFVNINSKKGFFERSVILFKFFKISIIF
ncbi:MAG: hypothetical protein A3G51_02960 [Candidatus Yanofskybacteria bacterium RIFCSPLOWO2_12_FULL_43_11b]|uniref:Uncharacterized protein n=1 Tax=Candidatus Yanofskybacteria bacterium RIFCSPLOWO2_12_FULL_43_11b TaxID=1802710 RepID=A0A1F8H9C6_9BACT|nr:MAG: hypothetical protein A3G51_02960 [Candidatus Yanofskybacteria bacterium RIFCSPLOWO2_12_FULL_43_11b]